MTLYKVISQIKTSALHSVHGIEWCEIYLSDSNEPVARYKMGDKIKLTSRPDYFRQFDNGFDRYQIDMRTLLLHGGARIETEKANAILSGNSINKPFNY